MFINFTFPWRRFVLNKCPVRFPGGVLRFRTFLLRWPIRSRDGRGSIRLRQIDTAAHHRRTGRSDSGEVFIDGKPMEGVEPRDRDIAMVFQSYALYPHMTCRKTWR